jgi:dipeptidyl aminopeptidase/acylaminoacyl peptidase
VPGHLTLLDVSPQGAALLVLENERTRVQFFPPKDGPQRDLTWLDWTLVRALSADGAWLLFDETGVGGGEHHSVYLRATDGSPAVRLGDGACFDMSPDGRWAIAVIGHAPARLDLLPCGAGSPRTIPVDSMDVHYAAWFPDGESLCVIGQEPGQGSHLYRVDTITGKYERIAEESISSYDILVSPDGTSVAARGPDKAMMRFPAQGGPAVRIEGVHENERVIKWSSDGAAIFVFTRGELPGKIWRVDLATGERKLWKEVSPPDSTGVEGFTMLRMSASEDAYAYSYAQRLNDLYVVEGLL